MANATDFIANVYDLLAKTLNFGDPSSSLFMQMAWPGIPISDADFKDASGKYNTNIAEETFSALSNIAPTFNKLNFENSGFEIDDLYEIVIASAIPSGVASADLPANPFYKLFADAQFEFVNSKKGSIRDSNVFYHPCKATPSNWYDEAASAFWPTITLKSTDIKPADSSSFFIKNNGANLVNKGVWAIKPKITTDIELKTKMQSVSQLSKTNLIQKFPATSGSASPNILSLYAKDTLFNTKITPGMNPANLTLSNNFKVNFSKVVLANKKKLIPVNTFEKNSSTLNTLQAQFINKDKYMVTPKTMSPKQSLFINTLLLKDLKRLPPSPATTGYSVSFRFCRVSIDRNWLNLALLKNPNWYMYGYPAGDFSNNSIDNNSGMFAMLPTSFIVISNLKITANWSADDKSNISNAASFGPFDIRNGSFVQNTLEIKGMQIIAWTSKVMPPLAPLASI